MKFTEKELLRKIGSKRKYLGYSQEFMAFKLGLKQATYYKIETGKIKMKLSQFLVIADTLKLEIQVKENTSLSIGKNLFRSSTT